MDPTLLEGLAESFSFAEIRKRSSLTRFCAVICETSSDMDTLENCGGIILPMEQMTLYVTFSPTADDTVRTSLPKEIRLALRSHKSLFYPGGLVLSVHSSISAPAGFIFQMTLLTLLCLEQLDQVPTPTERPISAAATDKDRAPQGYAPWLLRLLTKVDEDAEEGARPLPWLTPALIAEGASLSWTSSGNTRTIKGNTNISLCPGAIIDGIPQPFVVGPGTGNSPNCRSILVSIANPVVYHKVLHSGSDSNREFGLHVFPKSVL
jgi:hypothetical protein